MPLSARINNRFYYLLGKLLNVSLVREDVRGIPERNVDTFGLKGLTRYRLVGTDFNPFKGTVGKSPLLQNIPFKC